MAGGGLGGGQEKGGWFARRLRAPLRVQGTSGPWTRSPRGLCLHGRGSEACSETPSPGVLPVATAPVKSLHWPRITDHSRSFIKTVILTHTHTHTHTHTNTNTLHPPVRLFCISTSPCGDTPHPQTRGSQRTSADSKPKGTGSVISWTGFAGGGHEWQAPGARRFSGHGHRVQGVSLASAQRAFQARPRAGAGGRDFAQLLDLGLMGDQRVPGPGHAEVLGQSFIHFSARAPNSTIPQQASSWSWKNSPQILPIRHVAKPGDSAGNALRRCPHRGAGVQAPVQR